jgi:hypothetical protein
MQELLLMTKQTRDVIKARAIHRRSALLTTDEYASAVDGICLVRLRAAY